MEFLDALRDAQKELIASGDYRLLYKILNQRDKTQYENIKKVLSELDVAVKQNPNLASIKAEVTELLDRVSLQTDATDNRIDFNFSSPETSEMLKKISLIYGSNPINVARNGLGRNNLLYISLVLSHLSVKGNRDQETYFRLIAVEEPEAHLHPHLQDHLAANIESIRAEHNEMMQLLLTSHSTHIAAKLNLENTVIIFNNQEQHTLKSHYILSGLDLKNEKSTIHYLSRYLDTTKSRMFFARKIILVEGITEQLLIPKFFEIYFGNGIEKEGCNVINVNGVAFKHFLKVIRNGFFIKCVVLTDKDTGKKTQKRAENLKETFEQENLICVEITEDTTFEKDVIAANRKGSGKTILLDTLIATKPESGRRFSEEMGENDIEVIRFFNEIEQYKAEFAFNLFTRLHENPTGFTIPGYIQKGFDFMRS
jgi:putative ATP-dependent endonuclease of the OLD family